LEAIDARAIGVDSGFLDGIGPDPAAELCGAQLRRQGEQREQRDRETGTPRRGRYQLVIDPSGRV
jgi:hypothetical protein